MSIVFTYFITTFNECLSSSKMTPSCSKEREGVYIRVEEEERRAAGWFLGAEGPTVLEMQRLWSVFKDYSRCF